MDTVGHNYRRHHRRRLLVMQLAARQAQADYWRTRALRAEQNRDRYYRVLITAGPGIWQWLRACVRGLSL